MLIVGLYSLRTHAWLFQWIFISDYWRMNENMYNRYQKLPIDIDLDHIRDTT